MLKTILPSFPQTVISIMLWRILRYGAQNESWLKHSHNRCRAIVTFGIVCRIRSSFIRAPDIQQHAQSIILKNMSALENIHTNSGFPAFFKAKSPYRRLALSLRSWDLVTVPSWTPINTDSTQQFTTHTPIVTRLHTVSVTYLNARCIRPTWHLWTSTQEGRRVPQCLSRTRWRVGYNNNNTETRNLS